MYTVGTCTALWIKLNQQNGKQSKVLKRATQQIGLKQLFPQYQSI